jgi:hypothetical protein
VQFVFILCSSASWSFVATLFQCRRPLAVIWSVVAVVVLTVNGMLCRRTRTHIGIETRKRFPPCFTDLYAACTVIFIRRAFRVIATLMHASPHPVFWNVLVRTTAFRMHSAVAAGNRAFLQKTAAENILDTTTHAFADPISSSTTRTFFATLKNFQLAKTPTGQLNFYTAPVFVRARP